MLSVEPGRLRASLSLTLILDTLAEFQVQTGQQIAEYGHAGGAQINVVTKSGGSEWHGDGWEFVRNRVFDSRPFNLFSALPLTLCKRPEGLSIRD